MLMVGQAGENELSFRSLPGMVVEDCWCDAPVRL